MKMIFNNTPRALLLGVGLTSALSVIAACGSTPVAPTPDGGSGENGGHPSYTETALTLDLALATAASDGGGGGGGAGATATTLTITAHDGATPVVTDLWLYTLDGAGDMTPLTGFTSTGARKSPGLMLPATIAGKPSGLVPADNGALNGVMTSTTRGVLDQGTFVSTVTGKVVVTLPEAPTAPILVVAGVEDQRYAGAAVIQPDGSPGQVPAGVGAPEAHARVSFARDVAPILKANCGACHVENGAYDADLYLVTGTRDELVNDNFALKEQTQDCEEANPGGGQALTDCIQAIDKAQFLVEPGAPAVSDLLQRARPDEEAGTSPQGLAWYGSKGQRYNAKYGDRRMPSTTESTDAAGWTNLPTYFDTHPDEYQVLFDWVAQGAPP